jgi:hypothetical protein
MWQIFAQLAMQLASQAAQRQQQKAMIQQQQQQQDLQSRMIWQAQDQQDRQRRDLLKRQLASNRAALASGGGGFAGGSGAALLAGLTRQTEQDIADGHQTAELQHLSRFGTGEPKPSSAARALQGMQAVQQGLQTAQQVFGVFRPSN